MYKFSISPTPGSAASYDATCFGTSFSAIGTTGGQLLAAERLTQGLSRRAAPEAVALVAALEIVEGPGSGADRIVRAIRLRSALRRCRLCGHDVTPDQGGI